MYVSLIILFLSSWYLFSLLNQFDNKFISYIKRYDVFGIIPYWHFFAPNPLVNGFEFYCRDKTASGEISDWGNIKVTCPRRLYHFLWNPDKRIHKLFLDSIKQIDKLINSSGDNPEAIQFTVPYLILLNMAMNAEYNEEAKYIQFIIITDEVTEASDDTLVMASWFHLIHDEV